MAPNFYRMERLGRRGLWDDAHPAVRDWYGRLLARAGVGEAVSFAPPDGKGYGEVGLAADSTLP